MSFERNETMTRTLALIATLLTVPFLLHGQTNKQETAGQGERPKADQAFIALEQDWAGAVKKRDVEKIDRIQAEEFVFTSLDGRVWTKTEALDAIKAGDLEIDSFELSDVNVRLYENTAVVIFRIVWNGRFRGTDISGPQRMTDVFVKRDGRWQSVASHATRIQSA